MTKATINNTNEIINNATIAEEFPIRAGRIKNNKDSKSKIKENVDARFFAINE